MNRFLYLFLSILSTTLCQSFTESITNQTTDLGVLTTNISQSLTNFSNLINNYIESENKLYFGLNEDSNENDLSFKCNLEEVIIGKCKIRPTSDSLCESGHIPALIRDNNVIPISHELIKTAGITSDILKNMITNGVINCVPNRIITQNQVQSTTIAATLPSLPPITSTTDEMNRILLQIVVNLLNKNHQNGELLPNACPTCSDCKHCGKSGAKEAPKSGPSPSGTSSGIADSIGQLANTLMGIEQLRWDLLKQKIGADARLINSKVNLDLNLIRSQVGLRLALINSIANSLNSLSSSIASSGHNTGHHKPIQNDQQIPQLSTNISSSETKIN